MANKHTESQIIAEAQLRMLYASMGMSEATVEAAMARRGRHPRDQRDAHSMKGKSRPRGPETKR